MLQLSKMANSYFVILLFVEMIPQLQYGNGGYPDLINPIAFVVGLSMIKDIYEDF
jgi:hypothetical protein